MVVAIRKQQGARAANGDLDLEIDVAKYLLCALLLHYLFTTATLLLLPYCYFPTTTSLLQPMATQIDVAKYQALTQESSQKSVHFFILFFGYTQSLHRSSHSTFENQCRHCVTVSRVRATIFFLKNIKSQSTFENEGRICVARATNFSQNK